MDGLKPGYKTTEFFATLTVILTNAVAVLVVLGYVKVGDQDFLVQVISAIVGALAVLVPNVVALWKYITSRTLLKEALLRDAQAMRYAMMYEGKDPPCLPQV